MNDVGLYFQIVNNWDIALWFFAAVILLIVEITTLGLTSIWFFGGAVVALILAFLGFHWGVQIGAFIIVSVILLVFTRPLAVRHLNTNTQQTNVGALIGRKVRVTGDINNLKGEGQASVNGLEWTARSSDDTVTFRKGDIAEVVAIDGVKLIVRKLKED